MSPITDHATTTHTTTSNNASRQSGGNLCQPAPTYTEIKKGKLQLKQKPISFDKLSETLQEIVDFRQMLDQRIQRQDEPLTSIPAEHMPLIAKLVNESDKTLAALVKQIRQQLLPEEDADEAKSPTSLALPAAAVEAAVKDVSIRTNHGLENIHMPNSGRAPASLAIWRWEIKEKYRDWLPKSIREKADTRLAERVEAKKEFIDFFTKASPEERDVLCGNKSSRAANTVTDKAKDIVMADEVAMHPPSDDAPMSVDLTGDDDSFVALDLAATDKSENPGANEDDMAVDLPSTPKTGRPKKPVDPEKLTKEKEREEKKAAKIEKRRKADEAQNKSRTLMANFFGKKPKPSEPAAANGSSSASPSKSGHEATNGLSEYEKTFKPFVFKKNIEVAPINWLKSRRRAKNRRKDLQPTESVIIIDVEDETKQSIKDSDIQVLEQQFSNTYDLQKYFRSTVQHRPRLNICRDTVRTLLHQLSIAELSDDPATVRRILDTLRSRTLLPAKVFIFAEDVRPGYLGTWTRRSSVINSRRPFARDITERDYGYDSGEDWEEEQGVEGDEVDGADDDDDDAGNDDGDSDADSWLVDDDEVETVDPSMEVSASEWELDFLTTRSPPPLKRKGPAPEEKKKEKRRKVVVPLVPLTLGPNWEDEVGHCKLDTFEGYKIQLFNDTPYPIDPFTFVSVAAHEKAKHVPEPAADGFVVPPLPDYLAASNSSAIHDLSSNTITSKQPPLAPKTQFPDNLLPTLLRKIESLSTGNFGFIVESIHQDLKAEKVKKNAIEAKVREVGEKSKEKKVWVVKDMYKALVVQS